MRWSGWPLTVAAVISSLAISAILLQFGIFFFFLPLLFVPLYVFRMRKKRCHACGRASGGNFCPNCGSKM
jgi:rRNA maturation endonuclease Nob1